MTKKKASIMTHEQVRIQRIEQLAHMRQIERLTIEECARRLGVSERTVNNYLADDDYKLTIDRLRQEWKDGAITHVAELAQTALETMAHLMKPETKSEHVRFEAAKAIGDWLGLGQQESQEGHDDRAEVERMQRLLANRPVNIMNVYQQAVDPGGLLPSTMRAPSENIDELMQRLRGNQTVVDADGISEAQI